MPPSALPDGEPVPTDGALPTAVHAGSRPFGWYLHVPYCVTRCGYCDFNTYALGVDPEVEADGAPEHWSMTAVREIELAHRVLGDAIPVADTVFFGGGTPTLLAVDDFARTLDAIAATSGLAVDAEITTEANPESVTQESLTALRRVGVNRLSLGMQSAVPHVLTTLDRHHTPGRVAEVVGWARAAGFEQVSVDLIYGTPGESLADWRRSVETALSCGPDHVSAYALIVEPGTRLAAQIERGQLPAPDDDDVADKYVLIDELLSGSGWQWYEVSNWASTPAARCRHNLRYWRGDDWWGVGPGAHSHVAGVRWWNVKHPAAWSGRLASGESPAAAREVLNGEQRRVEDVLLRIRLADGVPAHVLSSGGVEGADAAVSDGLLDASAWSQGRAVLTQHGRLLADAVVRALLPD
jgi:putative oxygen-independent coproporphyrinogen III oxidase